MRYLGKPLLRKEDKRLITGRGQYVADIHCEGALHLAVLRSPHAHARVINIDLSLAKKIPGVITAASYQDLGKVGKKLPMIVPHPALQSVTPYPLAKDKVHYVGEPVAVVVAESRYIAEDALESIRVQYEVLPPVVHPEKALQEGSPVIHDELGSNCAAEMEQKYGDVDTAFAEADLIVRSKFRIGRCSVQPMETRGILAVPDALGNLTVWDSTQAVHTTRRFIADFLEMNEEQVRVIAPDVGGGFGAKNRFYPEEVLVPWLAKRLNRPVKWIGDRMEDLMTTYQERDQWHDAELAVRNDGTVMGLRDHFLADNGAFTPFGIVVPYTTSITIPGPYKIPNYYAKMICVLTNKTPVAPYRGAGRPQGVFVMERLLDLAAEKLGLDKAEIRLRNLVPKEEMPYHVGLYSRDGRPIIYHTGDYPGAFKMTLDKINYRKFLQEKEEQRKKGRYLGIGVANCIEMAALGSFEGARVKVDPSTGKVIVATGASSQGQGHETSLAQVCAERLGVPIEDVTVIGGDTNVIPYGIGTYASRTAVTAGNAVRGAALKVRKKALQMAGVYFNVSPEKLEIMEGIIQVQGEPKKTVTLKELAMIAAGPNTANASLPKGGRLPDEFQPGLEETFYYYPSSLTYANGSQAAIVEVDPETGLVQVLHYVMVHDCGKVLNPLIVEGQMLGAIVQGLGNALYEEIAHDNNGQLLTGSYMDYLLPTSMEVPDMELGHMESPDPNNSEGVKGSGEGGLVPVPAVINQAIDDALAAYGIFSTETPLSPNKIRNLLKESQ